MTNVEVTNSVSSENLNSSSSVAKKVEDTDTHNYSKSLTEFDVKELDKIGQWTSFQHKQKVMPLKSEHSTIIGPSSLSIKSNADPLVFAEFFKLKRQCPERIYKEVARALIETMAPPLVHIGVKMLN